MIPTSKCSLNILRLGLIISAVGWGLALAFTFTTWDGAADYMYTMGAGHVEYRPLMDYWLRMASIVMGCIGVASLLAARKPNSYESVIFLLGPFNLIVGVTLLVSAISNDLHPDKHPTFIPDIVFCFLTGSLITLPMLHARRAKKSV
ncbi:hypothetical protein NT6N_24730 [Oceaniferula spumae]|uniref:Uncharacterized protein n=1 Tax=Oceaniferula spumae TaxID=2979115 RepID=A0AAT9FN82_9BACT